MRRRAAADHAGRPLKRALAGPASLRHHPGDLDLGRMICMRLARSSLALLVTATLGACAAGDRDTILVASPEVVARAAIAPGPRCSPEQAAMLSEAHTTARARIREGMRFLAASPTHPHVRLWFGDTPPKVMREVLTLTLTRMEQRNTYALHCNDMKTCSRGQMGYMRPSVQIVGVCPPFFRARTEGQDARFGILVHEFSHLAARTADHVYQPRAARLLAKSDWQRASSNADNYEYFIEGLPR
jgi:hypothetical protein